MNKLLINNQFIRLTMIIRPSRAKEIPKYGLAAALPAIAQTILPAILPQTIAISAGIIMIAEFNRLRYKYKISDKEVIQEIGILNKSKSSATIDMIAQTKVTQNIIQKILNYGDLEIETWGSPMRFEKINKPHTIAKRIIEIKKDAEI